MEPQPPMEHSPFRYRGEMERPGNPVQLRVSTEYPWELEAVEDREPWERQKGESRASFAAFVHYRDMGPLKRSKVECARQVGRSLRLIGVWMSQHQWVRRADLWDLHLDRVARQAEEDAIIEMRQRHIAVGQLMVSKGVQKLTGDEANGIIALDVNSLTPRAIATLIEEGVKIERLARGEADSKTEVSLLGGAPLIEITAVDYRLAVAPLLTDDPDAPDSES